MAVVRGDTRFEELFDSQFDRCARLADRVLHDPARSEELAAEAFARLWARWDRLAGDDRAAGWLLRVTTNLAIDAARRGPAPTPAAAAAPEAVELATIHVALVAALQLLPRRQREVVALRYLADLSETDVAAALGLSSGSVKTHLHRGLARLRQALGPDADVEVRLALEP